MKTGLCTDARFLGHAPPREHPECPERLIAIEGALRDAGLVEKTVPLAARPATREELEAVHTPAHLDELARLFASGTGFIDPDTYFAPGSEQATYLAAGAAVELALSVYRGTLDNGLALVRPPGHHATSDQAMGFCLVNNVAVAAAALRRQGARVAIFDWDVHHGNGTEEIFLEEPDVLYLSTHEWPQYPGTGLASERGRGRGLGATVNVPLRAGTNDAAYLDAYRSSIRPPLVAFRPDLILVSAGFDAHRDDPLGGLELTERSYEEVTRDLLTIQPKVAMVLEGGYDLEAIGRSVVRVVRALLGEG